jgi:hypothetical protein
MSWSKYHGVLLMLLTTLMICVLHGRGNLHLYLITVFHENENRYANKLIRGLQYVNSVNEKT